jgi:dTDP-4-amino-4,6-dideoxygalactose transaminase
LSVGQNLLPLGSGFQGSEIAFLGQFSQDKLFEELMKVPLLDLSAQHRDLREELRAALDAVMDSQHFVLGSEVRALEGEIAEYCQAKHAVGCASGSDALILALMALDVGPGDEVITSPYSFFATVSAITRLGAAPVFVDIEPDTYNIDASQIEAKISAKTKAVMPVHLFGQCADMAALMEFSEKRGIPIVEDAAQAIGSKESGARAGSIGAIGCFSFYPSKNLGGAGDGGMLTTNDDRLAEKLRMLRVHGAAQTYHHEYVGLNSRLDSLQAAVLRVKLRKLDSWTAARQKNAAHYRRLFADKGLNKSVILPRERENVRHIYNQFVIRAPEKRDELKAFLHERGVGTSIYYPISLHLQKCFLYLGGKEGDLPESELASRETLALPIYPELTLQQVEYVVAQIADFYG